jgi:serine protease Do
MVGSPVFNTAGQAIGFVHANAGMMPFMDVQGAAMDAAMSEPPRMFTLARDFLPALQNPPTVDEPVRVPWLGVAALQGVEEDLAEFYEIEGVTAVTVGDVIEGFAAAEAGLQNGDIIVAVNGEELEKGDTPEEAPQIFQRDLQRMPIGTEVTLTVVRAGNDGPEQLDVVVELAERPPVEGSAARTYFEDLGFTVREIVFQDNYQRQLDLNTTGVVVSFIRPQSAAASNNLGNNDLIVRINQTDVESLEQFTQAYETFRGEQPDEAVVMEVLRGIDTQIIRIEPPRE